MKSRSEILAIIRRAAEYSKTADSEDEAALLAAGLMPKTSLTLITHEKYPERLIAELVADKYITETPSYLIASPSKRTRPIATRYDVDKPRVGRSTRAPASYRVFGRDRLALWYAAANHTMDGSRGEAVGLWLLLRFWRQPKIQRAWKNFIERPNWRLPDDAK